MARKFGAASQLILTSKSRDLLGAFPLSEQNIHWASKRR